VNVRNVTAQVTKIFKGIDNDTTAVVKMQSQMNKRIDNIVQSNNRAKDLVNNISNVALTAATTPAKVATPAVKPVTAKPVKAAPVPPKSVAKKVVAKPVKAAKAAKVAVAKPAKVAKAEVIKTTTKVVDNRPQLRQLILDTIGKKQPITAANIYHVAEEVAKLGSFKVWTRQSMYSLLEKLNEQKEIHKTGEGPTATYEIPTKVVATSSDEDDDDSEADRLVARVETTAAVADVQ
jgi:hypothetical protein